MNEAQTTAAASLIGGVPATDSSSASSRHDEIRTSAAREYRWFPISDKTRGANTSSVVVAHLTIAAPGANLILGTKGGEKWSLFSVRPSNYEISGFTGRIRHDNFTILGAEDWVVSNDIGNAMLPALSAIGRLTRFRSGWDSYGAPPVSSEAQHNAQKFLAILGALAPALSPPVVGPSKSAGVVLAWHLRDLEVDVEVGDAYLEYLVARQDSDDTIAEGHVRKDSLGAAANQLVPFLTQS